MESLIVLHSVEDEHAVTFAFPAKAKTFFVPVSDTPTESDFRH